MWSTVSNDFEALDFEEFAESGAVGFLEVDVNFFLIWIFVF